MTLLIHRATDSQDCRLPANTSAPYPAMAVSQARATTAFSTESLNSLCGDGSMVLNGIAAACEEAGVEDTPLAVFASMRAVSAG